MKEIVGDGKLIITIIIIIIFVSHLGNSYRGLKIIIIIIIIISIMLQRFNSVLLHDTLPVDLPDL